MRLVKCHIDHFGKLSDYTIEFTRNPQVFLEPNGWGKSTLASFIKVMFYGFSNERNRGDALSRERVRFQPWQGGSYGGELWFEAGGKTYLLNRTFGSKEAEDTLVIYDAKTNLPSNDFGNHANIGESLFQIDQDSFLNTVFIAQNCIHTEVTDGIHAKIGNLSDCMGDMKDFENVCQRLKTMTNKLTPKRRPGELKLLREEIGDKKSALRRMDSVAAAAEEVEQKLKDAQAEKEELENQKEILSKQWDQLTVQSEIRAKKEHYDSICNQLEETGERQRKRLQRVGGVLPSRELVEEMLEENKQLLKTDSQYRENLLDVMEEKRFSELEKKFGDREPSEETRERIREELVQLQSLREQDAEARLSAGEDRELRELEEKLRPLSEARSNPMAAVEAAILSISDCQKLKQQLGEKQSALGLLEQRKQWEEQNLKVSRQKEQEQQNWQKAADHKRRTARITGWSLLLLGILVLGLGAVLRGSFSPSTFALCCGSGVFLACAGIVCIAAAGRKQKKEPDVTDKPDPSGLLRLQNEMAVQTQEVEAMERKLEEQKQALLRFGADYTGYTALYGAAFVSSGLSNCLYQLKADLCRRKAILDKQENYLQRKLPQRMEEKRTVLENMLGQYYSFSDDGEKQLQQYAQQLEKELPEYKALKDRFLRAAEKKEQGDKLRAELNIFLKQYGQQVADYGVGLQTLLQEISGAEREQEEYQRLLQTKEDFECAYDVTLFDSLEKQTEDLPGKKSPDLDDKEELRENINETGQRIETVTDRIHSYLRQLDEKQEELDACEQEKARLKELEQEYAAKEQLYNNLMLTEQYLETARESLSARYVEPMEKGFRKYYELLAGESADDFRMDANIQVTRRAMGQQRDIRTLSRGNQDLTNLVLRIALISAMYQQEKPFLVLDDSFINLDGERLKTARNFMRKLSEEYQVLYFTCHESRLF